MSTKLSVGSIQSILKSVGNDPIAIELLESVPMDDMKREDFRVYLIKMYLPPHAETLLPIPQFEVFTVWGG